MTDEVSERDSGNDSWWLNRRDFLRRGAALGAALPALGVLAEGCGSSTASTSSAAASKPRRGGDLRVGMTGGSSSDNLDANASIGYPANGRCAQLYDGLTTLNSKATTEYTLAEEITPNSNGTVWTIRLRRGVTFHDGKDLTADDVIFTFNRILNPKAPLPGAVSLGPMDVAAIKKLDSHTLRVPMKKPWASFIDQLADYIYLYIVPVGYDPKRPVGTGPFKYQSNTPGQQSVFTRNENYWRSGLPYVDSVTTVNFTDVTSMVNALVSGQLDVAGNLDGPSTKALAGNPAANVIKSNTGTLTPFTMRVDVAPFDDARVRQALRLVVDRPRLVDIAFDGFATVGNDVPSPYDPCYNRSLHRSQDIDQAKSLLKAAGKENLAVELVTSDIANGCVEAATQFAQMAAQAGVKVTLRNVPSGVLFGPDYLKWPFSQDFYPTFPYLAQVATELLPTSPFNETHWDDPDYNRLYAQANATVNRNARCAIVREMMQIDFDRGPLIIATYNGMNDAYSPKVGGAHPSSIGYPVGGYSFATLWVT